MPKLLLESPSQNETRRVTMQLVRFDLFFFLSLDFFSYGFDFVWCEFYSCLGFHF